MISDSLTSVHQTGTPVPQLDRRTSPKTAHGASGVSLVLILIGLSLAAHPAAGQAAPAGSAASDEVAAAFDLSGPDFDPPDCPAWAKQNLPDWIKPFVGKNGLSAKWRPRAMLGSSVKGIDRYQANQFIYFRPETAAFLYADYTPLAVNYRPGTLPAYEKIAAKHTAGLKTGSGKALALLRAMPQFFRHPTMPPCGPPVRADRNLDDADGALLATGCGWCNEQARVFIRLCQVSGIPARLIHLFGQNHTVAEFHADGRWALADASNFFVAPGTDGLLLSVAQCHDGGAGQRAYAVAKHRRIQEMLAMSDEELGFANPAQVRKWRDENAGFSVEELAAREVGFGVINYPLPGSEQPATSR